MSLHRLLPITIVLALIASTANAQKASEAANPAPAVELASAAVKAVGGDDKLLRLFRLRERLVMNPDGVKTGSERVSVLEPPKYWWMNKAERVRDQKEPATFLVWAWTLGAIRDPQSRLEMLPDRVEDGTPLTGLRVSETISPPMDLYFDKTTHRLARIEWRSDIHLFSEWKEIDGLSYPSRTIGVKKKDGKVWYQTDIQEIVRLKELPAEFSR